MSNNLRKRQNPGTGEASLAEAIFSHAGTPPALTKSGKWYSFGRDVVLHKVLLSLGTAGTSSTVVTVYKNDVSIGTITAASGVAVVTAAMTSTFLGNTDHLRIAVTTVGTGAKDLTVQARFT